MKYLALLICIAFIGCSHVAKHYDAPNSAPLRSAAGKLGQKVTEATATAARASDAIAAAASSSESETAIIEYLKPKLGDLLKTAPEAMRPEIEALQTKVADLDAAHQETDAHIAAGRTEQATLGAELADATAAKNDVEKLSPAYFDEVDKQTDKLNRDEVAWSKDSKALTWYRVHWFIGWIVLILGIAGCAILAFLKFTGRLALSTYRL